MPRLQAAEPHLYVGDVDEACAFYANTLGFHVALKYGAPPTFAIVQRDAVRLALRLVCSPVFTDGIRDREELLAASLLLPRADSIRALFTSYDAAGVPFHRRLAPRPWGALDFIVRDPDGNLLQFVSAAD